MFRKSSEVSKKKPVSDHMSMNKETFFQRGNKAVLLDFAVFN